VILALTPYQGIETSHYNNRANNPTKKSRRKVNNGENLIYPIIVIRELFCSSYAYLPKVISSARTMEPKVAVIIMHKGLKAVTNTGPLSFITMPCT